MGPQTLKEKIIEFIGGIGWKVFIWSNYDGDENRYFNAFEDEVLRRNGFK